MGSIITLSIGNLEIDWGKNYGHTDHSPLFYPQIVKEVEYYYVGDNDERIIEKKEALVAPLSEILPRLELLGVTRATVKELYYEPLKKGYIEAKYLIGYSRLVKALKTVDVENVPSDYAYSDDYDPGEFTRREILKRLGLPDDEPKYWSQADILENFHPWAVLRLLANNPKNLNLPVIWRFYDVVDNGWIPRSDILKSLSKTRKVLVVTEGSSDTLILQRALETIYPNLKDFFTFIDMEKGYPFTGTGNLFNFTQGLIKIGVSNNIIVLYDNDTEGNSKYLETKQMLLPKNIRVMKLPDMKEFNNFKTVGPSGNSRENVNGRAVSIECFLDLSLTNARHHQIRWTGYNPKMHAYQGELEEKVSYTKSFFKVGNSIDYDYSKLTKLLKCLISEAILISQERRNYEYISD